MILNRIRPHLDYHLRKNQNGFRNGRTTTSEILAFRRLTEGVKDNNLEAILIFIDFKKSQDAYSSRKISKTRRIKHEYRENEIHELQY